MTARMSLSGPSQHCSHPVLSVRQDELCLQLFDFNHQQQLLKKLKLY